jgi:hypothetical protein
MECRAYFRKHLGPRFMAAGLTVSFEPNQAAGIQFDVPVPEEYREPIIKGIKDGMSARFPDFLNTGRILIKEVADHPVDSSAWAFYLSARCVIDQAYTLSQVKYQELSGSLSDSEGSS